MHHLKATIFPKFHQRQCQQQRASRAAESKDDSEHRTTKNETMKTSVTGNKTTEQTAATQNERERKRNIKNRKKQTAKGKHS